MARAKVSLLLLISFVVLTQGRTLLEDSEQPRTPPYEVKNSTKGLEVRTYDNATWVVSFGRSRWLIDFAVQSAGFELAKYFKGGNVAHKFIQPTRPLVATLLPPPHHKHHKNESHDHLPLDKNGSHPKPHHHKRPPGPPAVALAAYLPFKKDAPIPDSPFVKLLHTNTTEVFVHRFGGWAFSFVVRHEIGHLALALKDLGICPRKGKFFVATYNGPFRIFGRRNEIMWVKKPKHSHHNETLLEDDFLSEMPLPGLEALDVQDLFPEEFEPKEEGNLALIEEEMTSEPSVSQDEDVSQETSKAAKETLAGKAAKLINRQSVVQLGSIQIS